MIGKTLVSKINILSLSVFIVCTFNACSPTASDSSAENGVQMEQQSADTAAADNAGGAVEMLPGSEPSMTAQAADASAPIMATAAPVQEPVTATPEPAPQAQTSYSSEFGAYNVKKGDTLMSIAFNLYGDVGQWKSLHDNNKDVLKNANILTKGMSLKYQKPASDPVIERNGDPYKIKKGDTLGSIADDIYGKKQKWKKIWENNKTLIKDPNKIYAGFYVYYQMTAEERSEAEQIKSSRQLGEANGEPSKQEAKVQSTPTQTVVSNAASGVTATAGGLQGLVDTSQQNNRAPASVTK